MNGIWIKSGAGVVFQRIHFTRDTIATNTVAFRPRWIDMTIAVKRGEGDITCATVGPPESAASSYTENAKTYCHRTN